MKQSQTFNYSVLINLYISSHESKIFLKIIFVVRSLQIADLDHVKQFTCSEVVYTENLRERRVGRVMPIFLRANEND